MKKLSRKLAAGFLALAMVLTTALPYLPSIDVFAASKTMAHIVSGAENGNGHFGSATPEAFALSPDATFTNEDFSSTLKLGSAQSDTRARVVLKYKDDSNWHISVMMVPVQQQTGFMSTIIMVLHLMEALQDFRQLTRTICLRCLSAIQTVQ